MYLSPPLQPGTNSTKPLKKQWLCPRCVTKKRKSGGGKSPAGRKKVKGGGGAGAVASKKRKVLSAEGGGSGGGGSAGAVQSSDGAKKARHEWSKSQEDLLVEAVKKFGVGKWTQIAEDPDFDFEGKPGKALGGKWRTLSRRVGSQLNGK